MPILLKTILNDLHKFGRVETQYPVVSIQKNSLKPLSKSTAGTLTYTLGIVGESNNYNAAIEISGVKFSNKQDKTFTLAAPEKGKFYQKPSFTKNPLRMKCSCDDYMFRFSYPMYQEGGMIGMYKKYEPTGMYPPVNPDERLGLCKHLWTFISILVKANLVTK